VYAMRVNSIKDEKAEDVKNDVVARTIIFDYMRCLNEDIEMTRYQSCIQSKLYEVYTIPKIALSPYDKRYVVSDSPETLPWEYWRISLSYMFYTYYM